MQVLASSLAFQDASAQVVAAQQALVMGVAGTIPAATAADTADFVILVPFNMTLTRLKLAAKTAPTGNTTVRVRRGTVSAGLITWADLSSTFEATITANQRVGTADPADVDANEGDALGFSVTVGGGSGTNLTVEVVGKMR